jgi:hypothetical protein
VDASRRAAARFVPLSHGWSSDFDAWAADALARGDVGELAAFKSRAPGMPYAHPTPDHFVKTPCGTITATDAAVMNKIWQGPVSTSGRSLWYGLARGASLDYIGATSTVGGVTTPEPFSIPLGWLGEWLQHRSGSTLTGRAAPAGGAKARVRSG